MKKIYSVIAGLLLTATVWAQAPQKMSYQAVIRDISNNLVTSRAIGMRVSILKGSANGTEVYKEIYNPNPQTNANGLITIEIGSGIPITGTFAAIDWTSGLYFIKTEIDPSGGTTYTISGTSQLLSVPYALHAKTAESITDTHYVGELYGGGIVVSVWKQSGVEHGLIASLVDLSKGVLWTTSAYESVTVPGGAISPTDGLANSNAIIAQAGAGTTYAVGLCRAYSATGDGGLKDWYLPAAWEINECYNAAFIVNTILGATNGFQVGYYWSSSEYTNNYAWYQNFYYGGPGASIKSSSYRVRAVRRF